jgi:hypothetical protein
VSRFFSREIVFRTLGTGVLLSVLIPPCPAAKNNSTGPEATNNLPREVRIDGVAEEGPAFNVRPQSARFSGLLGGLSQQQSLQIEIANGTLSYQVSVTILNGAGWLIATPPSGTASPNLPSTVRLDVNFGAFPEPGTYQADVLIQDPGGVVSRECR